MYQLVHAHSLLLCGTTYFRAAERFFCLYGQNVKLCKATDRLSRNKQVDKYTRSRVRATIVGVNHSLFSRLFKTVVVFANHSRTMSIKYM